MALKWFEPWFELNFLENCPWDLEIQGVAYKDGPENIFLHKWTALIGRVIQKDKSGRATHISGPSLYPPAPVFKVSVFNIKKHITSFPCTGLKHNSKIFSDEKMSIKLERDDPIDRILQQISSAPRGRLTEDQLAELCPEVAARDRAGVINILSEQNKIDLIAVGDKLVYQFKKEVSIPNTVEPHEEAVYR